MKVKKIILFIFWLAIFVGVIFVAVRAGSTCDKMACEKYVIHIKVDDAADTLLYPFDIEKLVLKDSIIGRPYNEIDIYSIEDSLKRNLYVSEANIFGDMSGTLHIMAIQRTPVVRIINKYNESFYLDKTAHAMPVRLGISANVITVSGNIDTTHNDWSALLSCVKYISNDTFLKNQIGQIYVNNANSYWLIPVIGNHKIVFGTPENPEKRLKRLKVFYQQGMTEEGWMNYKIIDLRYDNQIVCKR
jgi:cell division protein FtsQ